MCRQVGTAGNVSSVMCVNGVSKNKRKNERCKKKKKNGGETCNAVWFRDCGAEDTGGRTGVDFKMLGVTLGVTRIDTFGNDDDDDDQ